MNLWAAQFIDCYRNAATPKLQECSVATSQEASKYHIQLQAAGEALEKAQPDGIDVLINNAGRLFCTLMSPISLVATCAAYCAGLM